MIASITNHGDAVFSVPPWFVVANNHGDIFMNCEGGKHLARALRTVRDNTVKIAEEIPESGYDFAAAPGIRTVRQMLTHIALSDSFSSLHKEKRTSFDGVHFPAFVAHMQAYAAA